MVALTSSGKFLLSQLRVWTHFSDATRNMHAHLCPTPVCRLCGCRWGACGTCCVCCRTLFGVCEMSCLVPKNSNQPHLPESNISECVRLCDVHMAYTWVGHMYVTTFRMTFLSMTHHVRTYILCENRSLIQSLALMRSAMKYVVDIFCPDKL